MAIMMGETDDITNLKVDVGVLKTQVDLLTKLCGKIDTVIERLVDQHDRHIAKVYDDMDTKKKETEADIKEINVRIDTLLDKMRESEIRLMDEIKNLRADVQEYNMEERRALEKILKWKWMLAGGIVMLSWLIAHSSPDTIGKFIAQ